MDDWQHILWLEWGLCDDPDYARRLYQGCGPFDDFYASMFFSNRPHLHFVERALYTACNIKRGAKPVWQKRLQQLEEAKRKDTPTDELIVQLEDHHWFAQFIARHALVYRGGRTITPLNIARFDASPELQQTIDLIIRSICAETTERLASETDIWLCPDCLTRCSEHWIEKKRQPDWKFYGCRRCRRSCDLLRVPGRVTVRLHSKWWDVYLQDGDNLIGNWFGYQPFLFDFDAVEIVQATDEEVERFAVHVGNDTDRAWQTPYKEMRCTIDPACGLSVNTVRILESIFGSVEYQ